MIRRLGVLLIVGLGGGWVAVRQQAQEPAEFHLIEVADSGGYFVYSYELVNPSNSSRGIASFQLDVAATPGTPRSILPASGGFRDLGLRQSPLPFGPHVPIGPITPPPWGAILGRGGRLVWYGTSSGLVDIDSVAPGDTLMMLGLRSTFLPDVRTLAVRPTWQSCCAVPDSTSDELEHPLAEDFAVANATVGPRYAPNEVTLGVLRGQLFTVCSDPLWIDDIALCAQFSDSLDVVEARLGINNYAGARLALEGFLGELDGSREPTGPVEDNAYWLLSLNAAAVRALIPGGIPLAQADVCASGPADSSVTINLAANGGQLQPGACMILLEGAGQTVAPTPTSNEARHQEPGHRAYKSVPLGRDAPRHSAGHR